MSSDEDRRVAVDWQNEVLDALEGKLCVPDFTARGVGVGKPSLEGGQAMGVPSTAVAVEDGLFVVGHGAIGVKRAKRNLEDRLRFGGALQRLRCGPVNSCCGVHGLRRPVKCSNPWPVPTRRSRIC